MRLSELIGNLYQSFITEDWLFAENLFDQYFSTIDKNHIGESNRNEYSISDKYESLFLYNYSLSCLHLDKYEKAEKLALRGLDNINYEFQYENKIYGYDLSLRLEALVEEIRNKRRSDETK
ncbi:MAG: hypothetical protein VB024_08195 [Dysgonamonadaceae bacterium]|nr:hypothetical protein [Dysgonamonadaceae bacterium]